MTYMQRNNEVRSAHGISESKRRNDVIDGLLSTPIQIGPRAVATPSDETDAILNARVIGASNEEIKALVLSLEEKRKDPSLKRTWYREE